jgi:NAD(P)-dependent dehydrogenase (short-subunit alcohol dehydrogenase family)
VFAAAADHIVAAMTSPDSKRLHGKVAIVTGASSGIGRAAALRFAAEGARVVVTARRRPELEALVAAIADRGGHAIAVAGDVRDAAHARAAVAAAVEHFGGLDVAFDNAGSTGELAPVADLSEAGWRDTLDTNLTGAFLAARAQVPALIARGGGAMIVTSSFVGNTVGMPGMAAYAAAKAGVVGLVKVLAAELGPHGIRVNALLPGATDTPALTARTDDERRWVAGLHALGRIASADEVAAAALALASDDAAFVTGAALLVDGGVSIRRG